MEQHPRNTDMQLRIESHIQKREGNVTSGEAEEGSLCNEKLVPDAPSLNQLMDSQVLNHLTILRNGYSSFGYLGRDPSLVQARTTSSLQLDRRIDVVVMMLKRNSHKQIAIEEIARLVNLSPGRLAHLFKSEMKLSIQQYVTQVRLAKAKSQLESGFLSIKEIAALVGFSSPNRFVVCFKNLVGATPAQYRKQRPTAAYQRAEIRP